MDAGLPPPAIEFDAGSRRPSLFVPATVRASGPGAKDEVDPGGPLAVAVRRELATTGFTVIVDERRPRHLDVLLGVDIEDGFQIDAASMTIIDEGRVLLSLDVEQRGETRHGFARAAARKLVADLLLSPELDAFMKSPRGRREP